MASTHLCCTWNMTGVGGWLCKLRGSRHIVQDAFAGCSAMRKAGRFSYALQLWLQRGVQQPPQRHIFILFLPQEGFPLVKAGVCLSWYIVSMPG
jgi:hypothetical protein